MILAFTGHRPDKLGGYLIPNPKYNWIMNRLREKLTELTPRKTISGMALGVDQWAAELCLEMNIPYVAAIPFPGQHLRWNKEDQKKYHELVSKAAEVILVTNQIPKDQYEAGEFLKERNKFMVRHCDKLLAVYNGTGGGTGHCIKFAKGEGKETVIIEV